MNKEVRIIADDIFNRHFVGFDRIFDQFAGVSINSYPPHNVIKTSEDTRDIEFALAGFSEEDISVTVENDVLTVAGVQGVEDDREYLWRGIAARAFTKPFSLTDYWVVTGAKFADGILVVSTKQEIPDAIKPKTIEIKS